MTLLDELLELQWMAQTLTRTNQELRIKAEELENGIAVLLEKETDNSSHNLLELFKLLRTIKLDKVLDFNEYGLSTQLSIQGAKKIADTLNRR